MSGRIGPRRFSVIPPQPERIKALVAAFATHSHLDEGDMTFVVTYDHGADGHEIKLVEATALPLMSLRPPISEVTVREGSVFGATLTIDIRSDHVLMRTSDSDLESARSLFEDCVAALGVVPATGPDEDVASLSRRLDAVQSVQEGETPLRCFLSYRFSEKDEALARDVERFLQLHNVQVLTGRSYEPRRIEEKVQTRLSTALDFVVYLITSSGDSTWLRDEVGQAKASGALVVPLVEDGVEFQQGLLGNVEYITFAPDHIGDVWISLTEALAFIRSARTQAQVADQG